MLGSTRYELGLDVFSTFPLLDACYDLGPRVSSSLVTVASLMPVGFTGSSCSLLTREAALQYTHTLLTHNFNCFPRRFEPFSSPRRAPAAVLVAAFQCTRRSRRGWPQFPRLRLRT